MDFINTIFSNLYEMTAFSNIADQPQFLIMYALGFLFLYLGIAKHYEPLLLIPIAMGILLANFPGGEMGVYGADGNGIVHANGQEYHVYEMGLGYEFKINKEISVQLQGRYYFGLGNMFPDSKADVYETSNNHQIQIVAAVWFRSQIAKYLIKKKQRQLTNRK